MTHTYQSNWKSILGLLQGNPEKIMQAYQIANQLKATLELPQNAHVPKDFHQYNIEKLTFLELFPGMGWPFAAPVPVEEKKLFEYPQDSTSAFIPSFSQSPASTQAFGHSFGQAPASTPASTFPGPAGAFVQQFGAVPASSQAPFSSVFPQFTPTFPPASNPSAFPSAAYPDSKALAVRENPHPAAPALSADELAEMMKKVALQATKEAEDRIRAELKAAALAEVQAKNQELEKTKLALAEIQTREQAYKAKIQQQQDAERKGINAQAAQAQKLQDQQLAKQLQQEEDAKAIKAANQAKLMIYREAAKATIEASDWAPGGKFYSGKFDLRYPKPLLSAQGSRAALRSWTSHARILAPMAAYDLFAGPEGDYVQKMQRILKCELRDAIEDIPGGGRALVLKVQPPHNTKLTPVADQKVCLAARFVDDFVAYVEVGVQNGETEFLNVLEFWDWWELENQKLVSRWHDVAAPAAMTPRLQGQARQPGGPLPGQPGGFTVPATATPGTASRPAVPSAASSAAPPVESAAVEREATDWSEELVED